jgi:hypothetical protein
VAQFAVFDTFALPEKLTSSSLIISGAGLLSILAQIMMSKRRDIASLTLCSDSVVAVKEWIALNCAQLTVNGVIALGKRNSKKIQEDTRTERSHYIQGSNLSIFAITVNNFQTHETYIHSQCKRI